MSPQTTMMCLSCSRTPNWQQGTLYIYIYTIYSHISILSASIHQPSTKQYRLLRTLHDIQSIPLCSNLFSCQNKQLEMTSQTFQKTYFGSKVGHVSEWRKLLEISSIDYASEISNVSFFKAKFLMYTKYKYQNVHYRFISPQWGNSKAEVHRFSKNIYESKTNF